MADWADLDIQVEEKKRRNENEREEEKAYDDELLRTSKLASLFQDHQDKERCAITKAVSNFRQKYQRPWFTREFDLNDPDRYRNTHPADAPMMPPGLLGEDPGNTDRTQRQKEQLREWFIQQQAERAAEKQQLQLEKQLYDLSRTDMDNKLLQLQDMETNRRRSATVTTKNCNLALASERRRRELHAQLSNPIKLSEVGFCPPNIKKAPPPNLHEISKFQKSQMEAKKLTEVEWSREDIQLDHVRVDSARTAMLLEMQQVKLNKQMRQLMDNTNAQLADYRKDRKPDIERGEIYESFFSQFGKTKR